MVKVKFVNQAMHAKLRTNSNKTYPTKIAEFS